MRGRTAIVTMALCSAAALFAAWRLVPDRRGGSPQRARAGEPDPVRMGALRASLQARPAAVSPGGQTPWWSDAARAEFETGIVLPLARFCLSATSASAATLHVLVLADPTLGAVIGSVRASEVAQRAPSTVGQVAQRAPSTVGQVAQRAPSTVGQVDAAEPEPPQARAEARAVSPLGAKLESCLQSSLLDVTPPPTQGPGGAAEFEFRVELPSQRAVGR